MAATATAEWPPLPYTEWAPAKETLHRYMQMVGKLRMSLVPFRNHWWHVTLSVSTRGISTGVMPYAGISVEVEFDLLDHRLVIPTSDGQTTGFTLRDGLSCARFHRELFAALNAWPPRSRARTE